MTDLEAVRKLMEMTDPIAPVETTASKTYLAAVDQLVAEGVELGSAFKRVSRENPALAFVAHSFDVAHLVPGVPETPGMRATQAARDAEEKYYAKVDALIAQGVDLQTAARRVSRENPSLHAAIWPQAPRAG